MGPYDARHITLDPGLTALALRGLHERDGHYPFVERFRRRRAARRRLAPPVARTESASAAPRPASWRDLLGLRRLRAIPQPATPAAADTGVGKRALPLAS
jgi:hypothetical protein